jgi:hypothetical protein
MKNPITPRADYGLDAPKTTGEATGVDIWQAEDLSGNRPEATLENARREGVEDRVRIHTADMRKLPFPDGTFDVVVSRAVALLSAMITAGSVRPGTLHVKKST